ncbi:MAG: LysO family transporter [Bacteroides sp.]
MSDFAVLLFMGLGISAGYLCRKIKITWLSKLITFLIWLLLFLLGVDAGSDKEVIHSLPTIGLDAVAITVAAVLGSVVLAKILWHYLKKSKEKE